MSPASLFLPSSAEWTAEFVEATTGFEPVNRGFADPYRAQATAPMSTHGAYDHRCSAEYSAELGRYNTGDGSSVEPHTLSARAAVIARPGHGGAVAFGGSSSVVTTLYRFFDAQDVLLYVGITSVGPSRWSDHERNREWWSLVVRVSIEQFPDRALAMVAERAAILAEQPAYNTVHMVPREPRVRIKGKHGLGTVIARDDGRWAFVVRVEGKQRWFNTRTEDEARLLQACHIGRNAPRETRIKAIRLLGGEV